MPLLFLFSSLYLTLKFTLKTVDISHSECSDFLSHSVIHAEYQFGSYKYLLLVTISEHCTHTSR